jgi:hypothetical protein
MRTDDQKSGNILNPLLMVGALALAGFLGAVDLARAVADMGPEVGDVIAFQPDRDAVPDMDARLDVARRNQGTCRLDVALLRLSGGSLVVERRLPGTPRLYQVHWSGPHTSSDDKDCGRSADLRLRDTDMEVLAMAAGGYGVGHHPPVVLQAWGSQTVPVR